MSRTVRSSTRHRPASPSHCLAPCGLGTAWGGQAWDRSLARLWRLLLCYLCPTSLLRDVRVTTRVEDKTSVDAPDRETSQQRQGARRAEETRR
ncbi:hypothetical protein Taro_019854 [Colocasia esculenta]|uniref:Uncharacterized protein n=1 Tax=Colocasia esculenta TaxID=4460 RepID=A0A843UXY8_COLES|nr:hypothetical protein [Colocasia esculenta]